jgi:hypothetical protein
MDCEEADFFDLTNLLIALQEIELDEREAHVKVVKNSVSDKIYETKMYAALNNQMIIKSSQDIYANKNFPLKNRTPMKSNKRKASCSPGEYGKHAKYLKNDHTANANQR